MQNLLKRWHLLYTLAGYICQYWYQYWRWWGLSSCQFGDFCHIISFTTRAELHLANEIFLKSSVDCKVKEGLDQAVHLNKILLTSFRGKMSAGKLFMAQIIVINCWEEGCIGKYASWAVPSGYPNPTWYTVFHSIPDPTRFSFDNHRVAGNPKYRVLPDISGKSQVSGTTQYFGYHL